MACATWNSPENAMNATASSMATVDCKKGRFSGNGRAALMGDRLWESRAAIDEKCFWNKPGRQHRWQRSQRR
jgi:hypothetical protein